MPDSANAESQLLQQIRLHISQSGPKASRHRRLSRLYNICNTKTVTDVPVTRQCYSICKSQILAVIDHVSVRNSVWHG